MTVISGGQTGADQTCLLVAREVGLPTGGVVPKGWRTDEGPAPWLAEYGCSESAFCGYRPRTRENVRQSDGTVWFGHTDSPGYHCTANACEDYGKPLIVNPQVDELAEWLWHHHIEVLNGAGNRRRTNPGVVDLVRSILPHALRKRP